MLTGGAFAGLTGVGVLALCCPILNTPHILVWHLGVVLVAMFAGGIAGLALTRA
jgi:hypothetical protein